MNKKQTYYVYTLILISILISSFQIFYFGSLNFSLIGMSDRDKLQVLHPEYYDLLCFTEEKTDSGSTILFTDFGFYIIAQPFFYPFRIVYTIEYENGTDDQVLLNYLKNPHVDYVNGGVTYIEYIVVSEIPFHLSTNETLFTKISLDSNNYILGVNRSAL